MEEKEQQGRDSDSQPAPTADEAGADAAAGSEAGTDAVAETATPARGGKGLAWLALLLAAGALGVAGWLVFTAQREDTDLQARLEQLRQAGAADREQLKSAFGEQIAAIRELQSRQQQALERGQREQAETLETLQRRQSDQLASIQSTVQAQRQALLELGRSDRTDWALAEAEYLLRLAYQRLLMARDPKSALALLDSADKILQDMDSPELHAARAAIARDMAALRAVPALDLEGTWLRIQALTGQVDKLLLFELPNASPGEAELAEDADWQQRLQHGLAAALERIKSYLVIRRRDMPYQTLLDPQWEQLVRQNLRMLLEQARAALLVENQQLYQSSLANSRRWLAEFFAFNESAVGALDRELQALEALTITRDYPDISGSLTAVQQLARARRAETGGS